MQYVSKDPATHILSDAKGIYAYVYQGDCLQVVDCLADDGCDMIFADPPFNIGEDYGVWCDSMDPKDFTKFTQTWIMAWKYKLTPDGVFCIHVPDEMVEIVFSTMPLIGMHRVDWIIWHYKFGQYNPAGFTRSKCHCLIYQSNTAKGLTFKPPQIESDRSSKYGDNRASNGGMRTPFDVWSCDNDGVGWGRVCGSFKEKIPNHPNQLPRVYLKRLIETYTNPGDFIADPFAGTGTTAKVGTQLGRHVFTSDINPAYVLDIVDRLQNKEL